MTVRRLIWACWPLVSTLVAASSGLVAGHAVGRAQEQQRMRTRYEAAQTQAYFDSCQALSAAVDRSLEANREHMLQSHGMAFVEGKGWVRQ